MIKEVRLIKGDPEAGKTTTAAKVCKKLCDAAGKDAIIKYFKENKEEADEEFCVNEGKQPDFMLVMNINGNVIAYISMGDDWDGIKEWIEKLLQKIKDDIDILLGCCRRTNHYSYIGYKENYNISKIYNLRKDHYERSKAEENEIKKQREDQLAEYIFNDIMMSLN